MKKKSKNGHGNKGHKLEAFYILLGTHCGFFFAANASSPIFIFGLFLSNKSYLSDVRWVALSTLAVSHASRSLDLESA